jgi:hypothetical protein
MNSANHDMAQLELNVWPGRTEKSDQVERILMAGIRPQKGANSTHWLFWKKNKACACWESSEGAHASGRAECFASGNDRAFCVFDEGRG